MEWMNLHGTKRQFPEVCSLPENPVVFFGIAIVDSIVIPADSLSAPQASLPLLSQMPTTRQSSPWLEFQSNGSKRC